MYDYKDIMTLDLSHDVFESFKVIFKSLRSLPDFVFLTKVTRWADCYSRSSSFSIITLSKDGVTFNVYMHGYRGSVKEITVLVRKSLELYCYDSLKIIKFKEFLSKVFRVFKPNINFYVCEG